MPILFYKLSTKSVRNLFDLMENEVHRFELKVGNNHERGYKNISLKCCTEDKEYFIHLLNQYL